MSALLDTNVLFAYASARDVYHDAGSDIVRGVDHGELPDATITNYVLAELLNLSRERLGPDAAIDLLDRLVEGANFDVVHATQSDFYAAQALFRQYSALSFVDATIVAYMNRTETEYLYSFDDDFDAVDGITRLNAADDPYDL